MKHTFCGILFDFEILKSAIMKRLVFISALFLLLVPVAEAQKNYPPEVSLDTLAIRELPRTKNTAFKAGEKLTYRVHYGFIDAGEATIEVKPSSRTYNGRPVHHLYGVGKTISAFNWFYKVHDVYESYIDVNGIFPWEFVRDVNEGGYKIQQNYRFHQEKRAVKTQKGHVFAMPTGVQDMLSAFYYARTMDFSNAKVGDIFTVKSFVDDENFDLRVKYLGKETIKTRMGKFRCMRFVPYIQEGRVFNKEEDLMIWITDDANKIPIMARANILVGSIKMQMVSYEGLANPIARVD